MSSDKRRIDISDSIRKLYDHVNLDIARILYSSAGERKVLGEDKIANLQGKVDGLQDAVDKMQQANDKFKENEGKIENFERKLEDSQKEYITILGIFASIVLAFTGGIAFSTSVLNNIAKASVYRTLIVSFVIGLVLVNILFGLFFYINKLVNRESKVKPLILSNVVFMILLAAVIAAWNFGWVESRDKRIAENEHVLPTSQSMKPNYINRN